MLTSMHLQASTPAKRPLSLGNLGESSSPLVGTPVVPGILPTVSGASGEWTARQDELLLAAFEEGQAGFWEQVAKKLNLVGGGKRSGEECAGRYAEIGR